MTRPDQTFTIVVTPIRTIHPCTTRLAEEAGGFYGFHDSAHCPDCRLQDRGFEFWGENGHCQGRAADQAGMRGWVARKVRQQWRGKDGRLWGYRFEMAPAPITYLG